MTLNGAIPRHLAPCTVLQPHIRPQTLLTPLLRPWRLLPRPFTQALAHYGSHLRSADQIETHRTRPIRIRQLHIGTLVHQHLDGIYMRVLIRTQQRNLAISILVVDVRPSVFDQSLREVEAEDLVASGVEKGRETCNVRYVDGETTGDEKLEEGEVRECFGFAAAGDGHALSTADNEGCIAKLECGFSCVEIDAAAGLHELWDVLE